MAIIARDVVPRIIVGFVNRPLTIWGTDLPAKLWKTLGMNYFSRK